MNKKCKHWEMSTVFLVKIFLTILIIDWSASNKVEGSVELDDAFVVKSRPFPDRIEFNVQDEEHFQITNLTCKSVKHIVPGNENNVCENLYPCSVYLATLTVKELASGNLTDKIIGANTTYATPQVSITELRPDKLEIFLAWKTINSACVLNFLIQAKSTDKEFKFTVPSDKDHLKIDNLNPCQEHSIVLTTFDVKNIIVSNDSRQETTLYAEPENVTIITFESLVNDLVKITWDPPKYKTCIQYYFLKWRTLECNSNSRLVDSNESKELDDGGDEIESIDQCQWSTSNLTDPSLKEFIITGLQGCENYDFVIYINNDTTPNSQVFNFTSSEQVPGIVTIGKSLLGATNATIIWTEPKVNRKCVAYYEVKLAGPFTSNDEASSKRQVVTNVTEVFFDNLDPCGTYICIITAISHNGTAGVEQNSLFDTSEAKPTQVRDLFVEPQAKSLTLSWKPPAFGVLCLTGYRLSGWIDENKRVERFHMTTNDTSITVDELSSCQVYTIQIIPTTKSMDGELTHIDAVTSAIVAEKPTDIQATVIYSHSLELSVRDADLNNNCPTIFARFVCEASSDVPYKYAEQIVSGRDGEISFKSQLSPLSPFSEYRCRVSLFNAAGWSENSSALIRTNMYFPEKPRSVSLVNATITSLHFQWQEPQYSNGKIKVYLLNFERVEAAYYIPPGCIGVPNNVVTSVTTNLDATYDYIHPYTVYSIQVAANNDYGTGQYTLPFLATTDPWISEAVYYLHIVSINGPDVTSTAFKANVLISWQAPCQSNGEILHFHVEFLGMREGYEKHYFNRNVQPLFDDDGLVLHNETQLKPEYSYSVYVSVVNKGVVLSSQPKVTSFLAPAGIPERIEAIGLAKVDAFEASNPTTSAVVRFPVNLLKSSSGTILFAALLLSQQDCSDYPQLQMGALDAFNDWPNSSSWLDVNEGSADCIFQYQTTPIRWKPVRDEMVKLDDLKSGLNSSQEVQFIIGTESCVDSTKKYCNGPLKADTQYHLVIRLFTKSGYNDAVVLKFKTDSLLQLTAILIGIIGCLLAAFVAGFVYLWVTKRIIWHRESCHGVEDSFGDVVSKNFSIFYTELSKPDKLQREFKELTIIATDLSVSASESNSDKNRYADIFPYDKNRVILDIDAEGSDYINASFINGYRRKKEYIATQGPKPESLIDFWRMILQHNIRVVVMVTQFREGDLIKCHEYFPLESKDIKVVVKKVDCFELYDRREITVTHVKQDIKRKVVHFYYKKWPDHGCPTDPMNLISFVRKVKAEKVPRYSPIVVHCSAGVGRTGTFIGLDIIMQRLKSESKINIFATVKELRFQRMKMVQTMQQYTFLYTCAFHLVKHKIPRSTKCSSSKNVSFQESDRQSGLDTVIIKGGRKSVTDPYPIAITAGRRSCESRNSVNSNSISNSFNSNIESIM